jgi:RNA-dependent RNA polymerase
MTPCIVMDLWRRELEIHFQLKWFNNMENPKSHEDMSHDYRIKIPLDQLTRIWETETTTTQSISHIFTLEYPPIYRRRAKKIETSFASENVWRDTDTWFRQTDIVHAPEKLVELPISLRKINSIINIGEKALSECRNEAPFLINLVHQGDGRHSASIIGRIPAKTRSFES